MYNSLQLMFCLTQHSVIVAKIKILFGLKTTLYNHVDYILEMLHFQTFLVSLDEISLNVFILIPESP